MSENLKFDDWIALAAAVVALCALFATIWEAASQRKHNRLSLRPYLDVEFSRTKSAGISLMLSNHGGGPAIIKSFQLTCNGTSIDHSRGRDKAALSKFGGEKSKQNLNFRVLGEGSIVSAGHALLLLEWRELDSFADGVTHAIDSLDSVFGEIVYESIYEERYTMKFGDEAPHRSPIAR